MSLVLLFSHIMDTNRFLTAATILKEYLTWAIEVERTRFNKPRRIAFIVVESRLFSRSLG